MTITHFDTQKELDDAFEADMEAMQERQRLEDLIGFGLAAIPGWYAAFCVWAIDSVRRIAA